MEKEEAERIYYEAAEEAFKEVYCIEGSEPSPFAEKPKPRPNDKAQMIIDLIIRRMQIRGQI